VFSKLEPKESGVGSGKAEQSTPRGREGTGGDVDGAEKIRRWLRREKTELLQGVFV